MMLTAPRLAVLAPVVASEQHRPVASLRRCFDLTRTSRNMVQGLYLLPPIIGLVINSSVHLADSSGLLPIPILTRVLAALLVAALTAWRAAVWALTYTNERVATEGLDLRLEMARVMP